MASSPIFTKKVSSVRYHQTVCRGARIIIINKKFSYNTKSKDEHEEAARPD